MTEPHNIPGKQQAFELDPLTTRVRQHLDASLEALDQTTLDRLAQARQAALAKARSDGADKPSWSASWSALWSEITELDLSNWLLPAAALASIGVMLLALGVLVNSSSTHFPSTTLDIELLSSSEQLDTYDNLDFYRWLALNEQAS